MWTLNIKKDLARTKKKKNISSSSYTFHKKHIFIHVRHNAFVSTLVQHRANLSGSPPTNFIMTSKSSFTIWLRQRTSSTKGRASVLLRFTSVCQTPGDVTDSTLRLQGRSRAQHEQRAHWPMDFVTRPSAYFAALESYACRFMKSRREI